MNQITSALEAGFNNILVVADKKINKAMSLFEKLDNNGKKHVLYMAGFRGVVSTESIREHFDNLELMDLIDDAIDGMERMIGEPEKSYLSVGVDLDTCL